MFKVGDSVVNEMHGRGEVVAIDPNHPDAEDTSHPVIVKFPDRSYLEDFTLAGWYTDENSGEEYRITKVETIMSKTQGDILREMARVSDLIVGTPLKLPDMFKYDGGKPVDECYGSDSLLGDYNRYTFALGVIENKPVFAGDTLWSKYFKRFITVTGIDITTAQFTCNKSNGTCGFEIGNCSWEAPAKKLVLNGEELPMWQDKNGGSRDATVTARIYYVDSQFLWDMKQFRWIKAEDRDKVQAAILKFLEGE